MDEIVVLDEQALRNKAQELAAGALSENTRSSYQNALRQYQKFANSLGKSWPPCEQDIALFVSFLANSKRSIATIRSYLAAISTVCKLQNNPDPCRSAVVGAVVRGEARAQRGKQQGKKAISLADLRKIVSLPMLGALGTRDRAMILLGFFGAFRVSELTGLLHRNVLDTERGLLVLLPYSKSDQTGKGIYKAIPPGTDETLDPLRAYRSWIALRGTENPEGFLWYSWPSGTLEKIAPSAQYWAEHFKELCASAGLDSEQIGSHSLRSGWATAAAQGGARVDQIQKHLAHATPGMSMRYVKQEDLWREHPNVSLR